MADQKSEPKSNNNGRNIVIGVIVLLLLALNVYLFLQNKKGNEKIGSQEESLTKKDIQLKKDASSLDSLNSAINAKIEEVQRLGGDTAELHNSLRSMARDLRSARGSVAGYVSKIKELNEHIDDYLADLKAKDEEIAKLKEERETIAKDNGSLRSSIASRDDSIAKISVVQKELDEKIRIASVLKADNVVITAIDKNGKERKEDKYRASKIEQLKVTFRFADNKIAKVESKDVYLRVIEPEGATLSDVTQGGGGLTASDGRTIPYTTLQSLMFDNSGNAQTFTWTKGSEYRPGVHTVEIWVQNYLAGKGSFTVR
jgi:SMC interacting uncharacterized protein involved in chromosome segregation